MPRRLYHVAIESQTQRARSCVNVESVYASQNVEVSRRGASRAGLGAKASDTLTLACEV